MPNTVSIAELERMSKAPSAVPTWLLREALQELLDLRHGQPAGSSTDVLITVVDDDEDQDLPGCVLLVCPRPQCLAEDQICETDRAERWNELEYSLTNGSLVPHDSGGGHYEHTGFGSSLQSIAAGTPDYTGLCSPF